MVTRLSKVAKYAGVSEATVSRVLHDRPGIAAATRDSVLTALDVMGYQRPFRHRSEMARLVGMVLPDLHNPIFPAYAEAMAGALFRRGLVPVEGIALVLGVDRFMSEARAITNIIGNAVATVVIARHEGAFDESKRALAEGPRHESTQEVLAEAARAEA